MVHSVLIQTKKWSSSFFLYLCSMVSEEAFMKILNGFKFQNSFGWGTVRKLTIPPASISWTYMKQIILPFSNSWPVIFCFKSKQLRNKFVKWEGSNTTNPVLLRFLTTHFHLTTLQFSFIKELKDFPVVTITGTCYRVWLWNANRKNSKWVLISLNSANIQT